MKPVLIAMMNLLAEMSSGQDSKKMVDYLHDMLIAVQHVESWKVTRLVTVLASLANLWDNEPPVEIERGRGGRGGRRL